MDTVPSANGPGSLRGSITRVRLGMREACDRSGRSPDQICLVAVTKTVPVEVIEEARQLGLTDFAENHASELARKAGAVRARWHFIGKLQRGTAPRVADHAVVIHSAEPGHALERVARRAAANQRVISCLLQVDFTAQRQGVAPEDAEHAVESIGELQGIELTGLMTLPPWNEDPEATRPFFRRLRELRDRLRSRWPQLAELSMGMSADYGVAIEEGATMVRVGTALFGERPPGPTPRPGAVEGKRRSGPR